MADEFIALVKAKLDTSQLDKELNSIRNRHITLQNISISANALSSLEEEVKAALEAGAKNADLKLNTSGIKSQIEKAFGGAVDGAIKQISDAGTSTSKSNGKSSSKNKSSVINTASIQKQIESAIGTAVNNAVNDALKNINVKIDSKNVDMAIDWDKEVGKGFQNAVADVAGGKFDKQIASIQADLLKVTDQTAVDTINTQIEQVKELEVAMQNAVNTGNNEGAMSAYYASLTLLTSAAKDAKDAVTETNKVLKETASTDYAKIQQKSASSVMSDLANGKFDQQINDIRANMSKLTDKDMIAGYEKQIGYLEDLKVAMAATYDSKDYQTCIDAANAFRTVSTNVSKDVKASVADIEKSNKQLNSSMNGIAKSLADDTYSSKVKGQQSFLSNYAGINDKSFDSLNKARDAAAEYEQIINQLGQAYSHAQAQGQEFTADFLKGEGWDSNFVDNLASSLDRLEGSFKNYQSQIKIDYKDLGYEEAAKQADQLAAAQEKLNESVSLSANGMGNDISKQMAEIQNALDKYQNINFDQLTNEREALQGFRDDWQALNDAFNADTGKIDWQKLGWDDAKILGFSDSLKQLGSSVKDTEKEIKALSGGVNLDKVFGDISNGKYQKDIDGLRQSINNLGNSDAKSSLNGLADGLQGIYDKMQSDAASGTAQGLRDAAEGARDFASGMNEAQSAYSSFASGGGGFNGMTSWTQSISSGFNTVMTQLNRFMGYNAIYREMRQMAKEMISTVEEIDTAMNQLQIVTGAGASEMDTFFENSIEQAKELGQSVTDVLDSIQVYSRLGYDLEDASELAKYTSILSNVAAVDVDEATTGLTSVIKGFDMEVSDAEHVADVLIEIGQNYAVSASEILEAFQNSSAAFGATGTSFEKAAAIIAAGNAAVQNASLQTGLEVIEIYLKRMLLIARTA